MPVVTPGGENASSNFKKFITDIVDPKNLNKAQELLSKIFVRGITLDTVDPVKGEVTNPFTGITRESQTLKELLEFPSRTFKASATEGGTLEKELEKSKILSATGELLGITAPIMGISKAVAIPFKALTPVKEATRALALLKKGEKTSRGARLVAKATLTGAALGEAAGTGAAFGFLRKPSLEDGPSLDSRVKNAVQDAIVFPVVTGGFIGARGILRALRDKFKSPSGAQSGRPDVDTAAEILREPPPPVREVELPLISQQEFSAGLDTIMKAPPEARRIVAKEIFPALPEDRVLMAIQAREGGLPPSLRNIQGDLEPLKFKIPTKSIEAANKTEQLQINAIKYQDMYERKQTRDAAQAVKDLLFERHGEIGFQQVETSQFVQRNKAKFSENVREDITFFLDNTGNPLTGDTKQEVSAMLSTEAKELAVQIRSRFNAMRDTVNKSGLGGNVGFIENYITHRYANVTPQKARSLARGFARKNPFSNARKFATFEEAMTKAGLKPLSTDALDLMAYYENVSTRVVANNRLIQSLSELTDGIGRPLLVRTQQMSKLSKKFDFSDYKIIDNPAFRDQLIKISGDKTIVSGTRINPEVEDALNTIFGKTFDGDFARGMTLFNAIAKKAQLSFSFFHHIALTESAVSSLGLKAPKAIAQIVGDFARRRPLTILDNAIMTKQMVKHGVELGAISDVQRGIVNNALSKIEASTKEIPLVGRAAKGFRKANQFWDEFLWDYWHRGMKAYAYQNYVDAAMKRAPHIDKDVMGRKIGQFVNDTFGGQNWELLLRTPQWRQAAHWMVLAPDWTLSTVRQGLSPFRGLINVPQGQGALSRSARATGELLGLNRALTSAERQSDKVIRKFAREFWARAALSGFTFANLLNFSFTKWRTGTGRFIWDNDPGHKIDVEAPVLNEKGRKLYIKFGKQFREAFRWVSEPDKLLGAKASPIIHMVTEQVTGRSTTGFPTDIVKTEPFTLERLQARGKVAASKFVPFAFSGNNFAFALPMSQGMTPFKTVKFLETAIENDDIDFFEKVVRAAQENNLEVRKLISRARSNVRRKLQQERRRKTSVR